MNEEKCHFCQEFYFLTKRAKLPLVKEPLFYVTYKLMKMGTYAVCHFFNAALREERSGRNTISLQQNETRLKTFLFKSKSENILILV